MTSRILTCAALGAVLALSLTACGDDDRARDASRATTEACRSYVLVGGSDADQLADEFQAVLTGTGGYNPEDVTARVVAIRAAAVKAGLTEGLPKKDFRMFAALVDATLAAETAVKAESDGASLAPAVGAYHRAVKAVDARCR